nr:hypothetical protein GCM10020093_042900 [Planobispora longispora]
MVMEDLAILSRTFGLRLLVELGRRTAGFLDEVGALGDGVHVVLSGPLDEADRKLLRIRGTVAAVTSPFAAEGMLDGENPVALGTRTGDDPSPWPACSARPSPATPAWTTSWSRR